MGEDHCRVREAESPPWNSPVAVFPRQTREGEAGWSLLTSISVHGSHPCSGESQQDPTETAWAAVIRLTPLLTPTGENPDGSTARCGPISARLASM